MKTKSKLAVERKTTRAARKGSSSRKLRIGDCVRITDISSDMKDPSFDLKDAEHREMRTAELFRFCLGREFIVCGFDRYGHAELRVDEDRGVRRKFGKFQTIWMEPEFLQRIKMSRGKVARKRKAN